MSRAARTARLGTRRPHAGTAGALQSWRSSAASRLANQIDLAESSPRERRGRAQQLQLAPLERCGVEPASLAAAVVRGDRPCRAAPEVARRAFGHKRVDEDRVVRLRGAPGDPRRPAPLSSTSPPKRRAGPSREVATRGVAMSRGPSPGAVRAHAPAATRVRTVRSASACRQPDPTRSVRRHASAAQGDAKWLPRCSHATAGSRRRAAHVLAASQAKEGEPGRRRAITASHQDVRRPAQGPSPPGAGVSRCARRCGRQWPGRRGKLGTDSGSGASRLREMSFAAPSGERRKIVIGPPRRRPGTRASRDGEEGGPGLDEPVAPRPGVRARRCPRPACARSAPERAREPARDAG